MGKGQARLGLVASPDRLTIRSQLRRTVGRMRAACALVLSATLLTGAGGAMAQSTRWSTPVDLAPADANAGSTAIGVDARGAAVIVWRRGNGTWESLTRTRAGRLTSRRTLPPGTPVALPRLVVGPRGDAVVLGRSPAALLRPGRQWRTLEPPGPSVAADAVPVDAGFDARGRMTALWRHGEALSVALLRVDGTWTRPRLLAARRPARLRHAGRARRHERTRRRRRRLDGRAAGRRGRGTKGPARGAPTFGWAVRTVHPAARSRRDALGFLGQRRRARTPRGDVAA